MIDYIRVFDSETTAIDACPRHGSRTTDGIWEWSTVGVSVVALINPQGETIPGFALMITLAEPDDDMAEASQLELDASLGISSAALADCVLRSDAAFTALHEVASITPMWMGRRYPVLQPQDGE